MDLLLSVDLAGILPKLPLSYLAIAALVFVVIGMIVGFFRGFGAEFLFLIKFALVVVGAMVVMFLVGPMITDALGDSLESESPIYGNLTIDVLLDVACYCAGIIALWIVTGIIWYFLKRIFLRRKQHGATRFFGIIFGAIKGFAFALFFTWVIASLAPALEEVKFFADNATVDPIGQFLIEQNLLGQLADALKGMFA